LAEEDEEYVGLFVEFPSLSWLAPTPQEALEGIRQVVADVRTLLPLVICGIMLRLRQKTRR
jgi:hypothetical protein